MKLQLIHPNGNQTPVEVIEIGRKGAKAPKMELIRYKGRLITPYEQKIRGWKWTITALYQWTYRNINISDLIFKENPFLKLIPKEPQMWGSYIPIPLEYGKSSK